MFFERKQSMTFLFRSSMALLISLSLAFGVASGPASSGSGRLRIFISDTHFGVGKVNGHWHNFEDARWAPEFAAFLEKMNRMGKGKSDLILNGDTFELWQSLDPNDCTVLVNKDLGCTEDGALKRLQRVIQFHQPELTSIGNFAKSGDNTVTIVPGNHDAALLFPKVAQTVLAAINAPADRVHVATEGDWLSPDGLIYAEHGQQIGKEVNKFDHWPQPFINYQGVRYLQRPWGEQFVQRFYNMYEDKYPIIDNISDESIGVKFGLKAEGSAAIPKDMGKFLTFYLTELSWSQLGANLGSPGEHPSWDVKAIRRNGIKFLAESLPNNDPLNDAAKKQISQGTFGISIDDLRDEDIIEICNLRQAVGTEDLDAGRPLSVEGCPREDLGAITQQLLSSRRKVFEVHLNDTYHRLKRDHRTDHTFQLFVYSHTHKADPGFHPLSGSPWNPFVVNTGAWQRTVTPDQLAKIQKARNLTDQTVLTLQPEDLPPCYPVILISPYQNIPQSRLQYWRKDATSWVLGDTCAAY
jgi:UDP-2,3-diacylglucosamine pyrophosphatase LpxH